MFFFIIFQCCTHKRSREWPGVMLSSFLPGDRDKASVNIATNKLQLLTHLLTYTRTCTPRYIHAYAHAKHMRNSLSDSRNRASVILAHQHLKSRTYLRLCMHTTIHYINTWSLICLSYLLFWQYHKLSYLLFWQYHKKFYCRYCVIRISIFN